LIFLLAKFIGAVSVSYLLKMMLYTWIHCGELGGSSLVSLIVILIVASSVLLLENSSWNRKSKSHWLQ